MLCRLTEQIKGIFCEIFYSLKRFQVQAGMKLFFFKESQTLLVYYPRFHLPASRSSRSTLASERADEMRDFSGCTGDNLCLLQSHSLREGDETEGGDVRKWSGVG